MPIIAQHMTISIFNITYYIILFTKLIKLFLLNSICIRVHEHIFFLCFQLHRMLLYCIFCMYIMYFIYLYVYLHPMFICAHLRHLLSFMLVHLFVCTTTIIFVIEYRCEIMCVCNTFLKL